jgi:glycosyltransferase involved in cell wall biosynthesis
LALRHIDYFLLLNNYHRKSWGIIPTDRICLTGVGIDHSLFENVDIVREPGKCIYFSHPGKGLGRLRQVWPQIKQAVPHATLHAFWNWEQFWLPSDLELGIMPMKWLSPADIAKEILSSSVLAYPSVYRELFPMTCMKAQRGGAVPVVVCEGGMDEVIQWGVKCNHNDFAAQVIAMLLDEPRQQSIREPMMEWAKQFTWRAVAGRWAALWET